MLYILMQIASRYSTIHIQVLSVISEMQTDFNIFPLQQSNFENSYRVCHTVWDAWK